jgi:predicted nucleic acid-binding protein
MTNSGQHDKPLRISDILDGLPPLEPEQPSAEPEIIDGLDISVSPELAEQLESPERDAEWEALAGDETITIQAPLTQKGVATALKAMETVNPSLPTPVQAREIDRVHIEHAGELAQALRNRGKDTVEKLQRVEVETLPPDLEDAIRRVLDGIPKIEDRMNDIIQRVQDLENAFTLLPVQSDSEESARLAERVAEIEGAVTVMNDLNEASVMMIKTAKTLVERMDTIGKRQDKYEVTLGRFQPMLHEFRSFLDKTAALSGGP